MNKYKFYYFAILLFLAFATNSCEDENNENSQSYDVLRYMDQGEYQKAIDLMEENNCSDLIFDEEECQLNLGACYYGLAGYDLISLGREIIIAKSDESDSKILQTIMKKFINKNMTTGLNKYTFVLSGYESKCNGEKFQELTHNKKQACLATNPILLMEYIESDVNKSTSTISIENLIKLQENTNGIFQSLSEEELSEELAKAISGEVSESMSSELEINQCATNSYKTGDFNQTACDNNESTLFKLPEFFGSISYNQQNINILKFEQENSSYIFKLLVAIDENNTSQGSTIVLTSETEFIDLAHNSCENISSSCFPKYLVDENQELLTLRNTTIKDLNEDEDFFTSIALTVKATDSDKTEEEKKEEFKNDICDSVPTGSSSLTKCEYDENGSVSEISEDAFLQYLNQ
jgi:hypothetical protein